MATFQPSTSPAPVVIDKFLGINEAVGQTQIQLGEAVSMKNFRITKNFKAQKREGYETFIDYSNTEPVYFWHGELNDTEVIISSNNGNIYEYDVGLETNTQIGTMNTDFINFFEFDGTLYIQNGIDYKSYDGTTFGDVVAYVPTLYIETPPAGGGTSFEELNILTGTKKQEFNGNNSDTVYQLVETDVDSIDEVEVDGVVKTGGGTDYTVNTTNGTVTFNTAPIQDALVIITWTKAETSSPDDIKKCKYAMDFGAGNDTNMFLWGNPDKPNTRFRSYIKNPKYFPANNFANVGSSQFAITDIIGHYSRQIIFKENKTYISIPDEIQFADGNYDYEYPIADLNEKIGNETFNQTRLINNNPVSLFKNSIYMWNSTNVEDERNAKNISDRIKLSLLEEDLSKAITFDNEKLSEYFVAIDNRMYVFNYINNTFYYFETQEDLTATMFLNINGVIYFSTTEGKIYNFNELIKTDNNNIIQARLELGFTDFGVPNMQKNSRKVWVVIRPEDRTSMKMIWQTNKKALTEDKALVVKYSLSTFEDTDFSDFSFSTNRNPQPFRKKIRAKKYAYIKFTFFNEVDDETLTILSIRTNAETAGEVR